MRARQVATGTAAAVAAVILSMAAAWACTSSSGPYISDLVPDRSPVGTMVQVKGGGWASASDVSLAWQAQESGVVERLQPVSATTKGTFEFQAPVPSGPSGLFHLVASQDEVERRMPFELSGNGARAVEPSRFAGGTSSGLDDLAAQGATESAGSGSLLLPVALVAGLGLLAAAGVGTQVRRRKARINSAP